MSLFESWNLESIKWDIYNSFKNWDFEQCIYFCDLLIDRENSLDDLTYDIYAKTFKWLSYQNIDDIDSALKYFLEVDDIDIDFELVLDDLWVYFFLWLVKSKLLFLDEVNYNIFDIINTTKKWFEMFPNNEKDFEDDKNKNLRLWIIYKYFVFIQSTFDIFWLKVIQLWKEDWTIKNFALLDESKNEIMAMFWYKRNDFYWEEYTDKWYRDMIDQARAKLQK